MTTTYTRTGSAPDTIITIDLQRTARSTGLLYLAFFITGICGSVLIRGQLFDASDAQRTLSNLTQHGFQPLDREPTGAPLRSQGRITNGWGQP